MGADAKGSKAVNKPPDTSLTKKLAEPDVIDAAIKKGIRQAVIAQAKAGYSVPTWRDGRVVWIEPAEILAQFAVDSSSAQAG
jgi:hypothetical protein